MNAYTPDFQIQITSNSDHFTDPFPAPDKLVVMLLVENNAASTSNITVTPQHSNDSRNWLDKSALTLDNNLAATTAVTAMSGGDNGSVPNMSLMRLKIQASGTPRPVIRGYLSSRRY